MRNWVRIWLPVCALMLAGTGADAQKKERVWSLQAGVGQVTMVENKGTGDKYWAPEDLGNAFYVTADYFLTSHIALNGGLTFEEQGLCTDLADGIGLKKFYIFGLQAGAKYYFAPSQWALQPFVGLSLHTNILNLGHQRGEHPVLIRDAFIGLWGRTRAQLYFTDGPNALSVTRIDERNERYGISWVCVGTSPPNVIPRRTFNNIFQPLEQWGESHSDIIIKEKHYK